jgi:SAM-dependent methyltransferase
MNQPTLASDFAMRGPTAAGAPETAGCPCCGSSATQTLYRVPSVPVHSCILLNSAEEARRFPCRDLQIAFCHDCGFLFNEIFDEAAMSYAGNFEESRHFSDTFNLFAKTLARDIARKCRISGKHVLEIGCGKGEFLRQLCRVGGATSLGVDPGYHAGAGRGADDDEVQFIIDYFKPDGALNADVILCRHTLEHIAPVREFVRSIREGIDSRASPWIVFETPNAKRVLEEGAFWDMYYEHCSYFSPGAHARLFREQGFEVTDLTLEYGRQYIVQYARPTSGRTTPRLGLEEDLTEMQALAQGYPERVKRVQDAWRGLVTSESADGRTVVLWGGGSKGVSFLTTLGLDDEVAAVVDVNPYKRGKFMPGSAHRVVAPTELIHNPPDLVIVMNPMYVLEIRASLKAMNLHPDIIAVGV